MNDSVPLLLFSSVTQRWLVRVCLLAMLTTLVTARLLGLVTNDWLWPAAVMLTAIAAEPLVATAVALSLGLLWGLTATHVDGPSLVVSTLLYSVLAWLISRHHQALLQYHRLARLDPLTRLLNRAAFYEFLNAENARSTRFDRPFAVAIIDCDNFKLLNDTAGHLAGDYALAELGRLLRQSARDFDGVGRLGGDEFGLVLTEVTADQADGVFQRLLDLSRQGLPHGLTFSIGACWTPHGVADVRSLVNQADQALYQAKARGRNQVLLIRRPIPTPMAIA